MRPDENEGISVDNMERGVASVPMIGKNKSDKSSVPNLKDKFTFPTIDKN